MIHDELSKLVPVPVWRRFNGEAELYAPEWWQLPVKKRVRAYREYRIMIAALYEAGVAFMSE